MKDKIYTACDLISLRDYPCAINDKEGQKKAKAARDKDIKWAIAHDLRSAKRYEELGLGFSVLPALAIFTVYLILMFILWG